MIGRNVVLDSDHLAHVVKYFSGKSGFAYDVETTGEHRGVPHLNTVVWLSMATDGMAVAIPMGHPNGVQIKRATKKLDKLTRKFIPIPAVFGPPPDQLTQGQVWDALEPLLFSDRMKVAYGGSFDFVSVAKYYGDSIPPPPYGDPIVVQWLINENLKQYGLKPSVKRHYGVTYDAENVGKCVEKHSFNVVAHYAYMDAKYTWLLWRKLEPLLDDEGVRNVWKLEQDLYPVLLRMRQSGAAVDVDMLHEMEPELRKMLEGAEGDIYRAAGRAFNLNAHAQKAQVLYASKKEGGQGLKPKVLTPGGIKKQDDGVDLDYSSYSTKAEVLENYVGNPVVDAMLRYSDIHKLHSTYVLGYLGYEDEEDPKKSKPCQIFNGRIHADLVQYGTVTGRFSCREPNLQNIPRPDTPFGKKIRGIFIAPPGCRLVVADYGQIEMVILGHYIGHGALYEGLLAGMDPHSATAAGLHGIDLAEFTARKADGDPEISKMRQVAKGINFAVVYGAGPEKVAAMAEISVKQANRFLDIHQSQFPEIYVFKESVLDTCRSRKPPYVKTLLGRKRRLPTILSRDWGTRGYAERQAVNSIIQGSAADIIKLAMIRLDVALEDDMRLILSVHDELVVQTPESKAKRCADIVREAMTGDGISRLLKTPLGTDVKIVERWAEAK